MAQQKPKNNLGYARFGSKNNNSKSKQQQSKSIFEIKQPNHPQQYNTRQSFNIYQSIVKQMPQTNHKYLNKLAISNSKNKINRQSKTIKNHERAKSYADMTYNSFSKRSMQKHDGYSCQKQGQTDEQQSSKKQIKIESFQRNVQKNLYLDNNSKNNQRQKQQKNLNQKSNEKNKNRIQYKNDVDFVKNIDNYIQRLSRNRLKKYQRVNERQRLQKRLQQYEKRLKQMQLNNYMEIKRLKRKEQGFKIKINEMYEIMEIMQQQVNRQKKQKQILANLIYDIQKGISQKFKSDKKIIQKYPQKHHHQQCSQQQQQIKYDYQQVKYSTTKNILKDKKKEDRFYKHNKIKQQDSQNQ